MTGTAVKSGTVRFPELGVCVPQACALAHVRAE